MADDSGHEDPEPSSAAADDGTGAGQEAIEEVTEDESPKPISGHPVLESGELLLRMRERARGRLAMLLAGLAGIVLIANVVADFRLPPADTVEQLKNLLSVVVAGLVGTLITHYFPKN
ncbi:hypothetical protein [Kribbella ginsengisoli]|uniref:Holin n=1 Tax=Kribbella ginsengisoli TaxID=363865 RepID=A0ABP6XNH0_9ACTN